MNLPEKLLYDFRKKPGDTVFEFDYNSILYNNQWYGKIDEYKDTGYIIDSVITRPMLLDSLRFYYGHYLGFAKWRRITFVEGVGSIRGLLRLSDAYGNWLIVSCKFIDSTHQYKTLKGTMFDLYLDTSCYIPERNSGITQIENNNFSIYPNPFYNKLTIEGKPLQNCNAEVYDITGKLLETIIVNGNEISFNNYYNGLILIRIFDTHGNTVGVVKGVKL